MEIEKEDITKTMNNLILRRLGLICIITFCNCMALFASVAQDSLARGQGFPSHSLGLSASAFLNTNTAVQFNYAHGLSRKWRIKSDLGYIFFTGYEGRANGFRFKPSIQYLVYGGSFGSTYVGLSYNYTYSETVATQILDFPGQFFRQNSDYLKKRNFQGVELVAGGIINASDHINIDLAYGLGYGQLRITEEGKNEDIRGVDRRPRNFWSPRSFENLFRKPKF